MKSYFLSRRNVSIFILPRILLCSFTFLLLVEFALCLVFGNKLDLQETERLKTVYKCNNLNDKTGRCDTSSSSVAPVQTVELDSLNVGMIPYDAAQGKGQSCEEYDSCSDKLGFEAIRALHRQLDDDANGNVDITESDEFLRDELQYENGYERQKVFHGNDKHISVDELWNAWKQSEVHNWTVEETILWLIQFVELPQYIKVFEENAVDGTTLPRIAVNNMQFLNSILGIKDPIHKQKLSLKAMDIVLFGIPRHRNYVKDILLILSVLIAVTGCWFAYVQHKSGQIHLKKMMKDMDSLQKAEEALQLLQYELDKAREEQMSVVMEKQNLERRLYVETKTPMGFERETYDESTCDQTIMQQLENEIQFLRNELKRTEDSGWKPPVILQHWLQLTHELELKHYTAKKTSAERQLAAAKEGCDKLRKKRTTFLGTFRIAHGNTIDDVDGWILKARNALSEITKDLQERLYRWRQIELLCGFPIVSNAGLLKLEALLQRPVSNGSSITKTISSVSIPSTASPSLMGLLEQGSNIGSNVGKLTPSSSESAIDSSVHSPHFDNEVPTDDEFNNPEIDDFAEMNSTSVEHGRASFKIGESFIRDIRPVSNRGLMFKSYSHDNQSPPREVVPLSRSESSLECANITPSCSSSSIGIRVKSSNILSSFQTPHPLCRNTPQGSDDTCVEKKNRSFLNKLKKRKLKTP